MCETNVEDMHRTPEQVTERLDCLIDEIHQVVQSTASSWPGGPTVAHATRQARDVVCIGHGHTLAALALRWADQPIRSGMRLLIEPSSVAVLWYVSFFLSFFFFVGGGFVLGGYEYVC